MTVKKDIVRLCFGDSRSPIRSENFALVLNQEDKVYAFLQFDGSRMDTVAVAQALIHLANSMLLDVTGAKATEER